MKDIQAIRFHSTYVLNNQKNLAITSIYNFWIQDVEECCFTYERERVLVAVHMMVWCVQGTMFLTEKLKMISSEEKSSITLKYFQRI